MDVEFYIIKVYIFGERQMTHNARTTILKPQSLASWNELHTACTVWPRFVSRATSSYTLCTPAQHMIVMSMTRTDPRTRRSVEGTMAWGVRCLITCLC
jgi:hypothetical protein